MLDSRRDGQSLVKVFGIIKIEVQNRQFSMSLRIHDGSVQRQFTAVLFKSTAQLDVPERSKINSFCMQIRLISNNPLNGFSYFPPRVNG